MPVEAKASAEQLSDRTLVRERGAQAHNEGIGRSRTDRP
jgi:hypothetical protein